MGLQNWGYLFDLMGQAQSQEKRKWAFQNVEIGMIQEEEFISKADLVIDNVWVACVDVGPQAHLPIQKEVQKERKMRSIFYVLQPSFLIHSRKLEKGSPPHLITTSNMDGYLQNYVLVNLLHTKSSTEQFFEFVPTENIFSKYWLMASQIGRNTRVSYHHTGATSRLCFMVKNTTQNIAFGPRGSGYVSCRVWTSCFKVWDLSRSVLVLKLKERLY